MSTPRPTKPAQPARPATPPQKQPSQRPPGRPLVQAKPPGPSSLPIIIAVGLFVLIAVAVAAYNYLAGGSQQPIAQNSQENKPAATTESKPPTETTPGQPPAEESPLIDDDGHTLWASPTDGQPLDLAYVSPGAQVIAALRPTAILKNAEGEKVRAALGPLGQRGIEYLETTTGVPLADMERVVVGCQSTGESGWLDTIVVHATKPLTRDTILAKHADAAEKEYNSKKYWLTAGRAYYLPSGAGDKILVAAPEDAMKDIIDLDGRTPPLRRDIERLIAHTDRDRQVTIVVAPNSLFNEGQTIFDGPMTRLRLPLYWFLGDELSGAALSLDWGDNFFLELTATPTLEMSPEKAARIFSERVAQIPDKLEEYVVNLSAQPYGRLVIARFPEMLRKLSTYTRSGFEKDHTTLRCYLPAIAGHNLLLAADLTLAEPPNSPSGLVASATRTAPQNTPPSATSLKEKLAKVTSLKFTKDTLESALEQLSQDIGAPIVIRGPDLQADGITKNQSFGIDLASKPAAEILVEILRLANPDKTATGPNDKRQKLVYIIEQKPHKSEQIVVTTRARVAERKDMLPDVFKEAK